MLSIAPSTVTDKSSGSTSGAATGGIERRAAPRVPASALPGITGLRMSPHGIEATLVNISATGLLAQCSERLQTGSQVTVMLEGDFPHRAIDGRVVRNLVASMSEGRLQYHIGIHFDRAIALPAAKPEPAAQPAAAAVPVAVSVPVVRNRW